MVARDGDPVRDGDDPRAQARHLDGHERRAAQRRGQRVEEPEGEGADHAAPGDPLDLLALAREHGPARRARQVARAAEHEEGQVAVRHPLSEREARVRCGLGRQHVGGQRPGLDQQEARAQRAGGQPDAVSSVNVAGAGWAPPLVHSVPMCVPVLPLPL